MSSGALPVETPQAVAAGTIVTETANPADGGENVHIVGGTVIGQVSSIAPFQWTITTPGSLDPPAWAATTGYVVGTVVKFPSGSYGRCSASGTSGGTAPTETSGSGITDGSAAWTIVASFPYGVDVQAVYGAPTVGSNGSALWTPGGGRHFGVGLPNLLYVAGAGFQLIVEAQP
jgi:hypothetical protein